MFEARLSLAQQKDESDILQNMVIAVRAIFAMIPPMGATRGGVVVDDERINLSSTTAEQRNSSFQKFLQTCPTGNFSDFLQEIRNDSNPEIQWDIKWDKRWDKNFYEDEHENSEEDDGEHVDGGDDFESPSKRVRTGPVEDMSHPPPSTSSSSSLVSSSSSSSSLSSSKSSRVTSCKFTFDDYVRMCKDPAEMLFACVDTKCTLRRTDHAKASDSSYKMPSQDCFPRFRDHKDKNMSDPHEFLIKLERQLKLYSVPVDRYGAVLISCLPDRLMQDWVETNIVGTCQSWDDVKRRFKEKYDDPEIKNQLMVQLERCVQGFGERIHQYTERFQSLVVRISSGAPIDTQMNIITCERGFIPDMRSELAKFRSMKSQALGRPFEFNTLNELYEAAATLERGLNPRLGRVRATTEHNRKRDRNGKHRPRLNYLNQVEFIPESQNQSARISKIEISESGKPVNVNKKHKSRNPNVPNSGRGRQSGGRNGFAGVPNSRSVPTGSAGQNSGAGGATVRGGFTQQRPAGNGGGGPSSRNVQNSTSGGGGGPSPNNNNRAEKTGNPAATSFNGKCHGCQQMGHRVRDCPNMSRASAGGGTGTGAAGHQ
jgi:hypothetical protein